MKNSVWIAFLILIALTIAFLSTSNLTTNLIKIETASDSDLAISNGIKFLNSKYSKDYLFNDPYMTCTNQLPDCIRTYRRLDTATVITFFLSEDAKSRLLTNITADSDSIIQRFLSVWKNEDSENKPIDLYAVFVYFFPNETQFMLQDLIKKESLQGEWETYEFYDYYPGQTYRKITDEAWPISAMAKNKVDFKILKPALDKKKEEAEKIINKEFNFTKQGSYFATAHILKVFYETEKSGYNISDYKETINNIKYWLADELTDPETRNWTVLMAEGLYWLSEVKYEDKDLLTEISRELIRRQEKDGGWKFREMKLGENLDGIIVDETYYDTARVQTTLLAILALENLYV